MADSVIDSGIKESVADENIKVGAGGPAFWMNLGMKSAVVAQDLILQNAIGSQQRMNELAVAAAGAGLKQIGASSDIATQMGDIQTLQSNMASSFNQMSTQVANAVQSLNSALASAQIGAKIGQTTPPQTGDPLLQQLAAQQALQNQQIATLAEAIQSLAASLAGKTVTK